ncbi:arsenite S-adenosylmethyltransferase [Brachionus plicatilis]|uniref:Arsenite methyltransferase n=1 Tax=Brachionus plicatilis TaxID=10195 RepID=A0A3M7RIL6_BRAPC|nr:arsenite S-adenosylmethyltransferase [Brachionus plicatilis]
MSDSDISMVKESVKDCYGQVAAETLNNKDLVNPLSCGGATSFPQKDYNKQLGYTDEELNNVPDEAILGLGCGNPNSIAQIKEGQTVLDLGSGAGFDCFIARRKVGEAGRVIGEDMTQGMIEKARRIAEKNAYKNVEFRLGEIESLPIEDNSIDIIISNCVVNLSPAKNKVYKEAYRVLKPGGQIAISDMIATSPIPDWVKNSQELYNGCGTGVSTLDELNEFLNNAGFQRTNIKINENSRQFIKDWEPTGKVQNFVASATIQATKQGEMIYC